MLSDVPGWIVSETLSIAAVIESGLLVVSGVKTRTNPANKRKNANMLVFVGHAIYFFTFEEIFHVIFTHPSWHRLRRPGGFGYSFA